MAIRNFGQVVLFAVIGLFGLKPASGGSATVSVVLSSSANPSVFGQAAMFVATVSPPAATGSVTFYDGTTVLGSGKLANGQATLGTVLASGVRSVRAFYAGDAAYASGMSSVLLQRVETVPAEGFGPGFRFAGYYGPAVTLADLNGDGKQDLAISSPTGGLRVYLGNGDGTFQASPDAHFDGYPRQILVGDFNGDGKSDLVTFLTTGGVSVLLGNGDGTFQSRIDYPSGNYPVFGAIADFNSDGKSDLLVINSEGSVSVYLGSGDGSFQPRMSYPAAPRPNQACVGDFNNDGNADFVVANGDGTLSVFLGVGDGSFRSGATFFAGVTVDGAVLVDDFNGDGNIDIVTVSPDGYLNVYLGNGDGTFRTPVSYSYGYPQNAYQVACAVADFNGDGFADLAVTDPLGLAILLGNGDGTFQEPVYHDGIYNSVAVADFDGDGRTDVVLSNFVGNSDPLRVSVLLGAADPQPSITSTGTVTAAGPASYAPGLAPGSLAFAYGNFLLDSPSVAGGLPLPNNLAGVSLQFDNGLSAPVLAASNGRVTFQVPWEMAGQSRAMLVVTVNGRTGAAQPVALAPFAPAIFSVNGRGTGQAAIFDLSNRLVDASNPATPGSTVLQIYCTGLGVVQANQPATGFPASGHPLSMTATIPDVYIGNTPASVLFCGLVPGLVGVYQVNALLPAGVPRGTMVPVTLGPYSNAPVIAIK
jgi:uncharacterized protein (TIGR03437 family)